MPFPKLEDHPAWSIIQSYSPSDHIQAWQALLVYLDLVEGKKWWNMRIHYSDSVSKVFLSGHESRSKAREIILPLSAESDVCPATLCQYQEQITLPYYQTDGLILAICDTDCSTVYYRVNDGLVPPEAPEVVVWKKYRREELPNLQRQHVSEQSTRYLTERREASEEVNK